MKQRHDHNCYSNRRGGSYSTLRSFYRSETLQPPKQFPEPKLSPENHVSHHIYTPKLVLTTIYSPVISLQLQQLTWNITLPGTRYIYIISQLEYRYYHY